MQTDLRLQNVAVETPYYCQDKCGQLRTFASMTSYEQESFKQLLQRISPQAILKGIPILGIYGDCYRFRILNYTNHVIEFNASNYEARLLIDGKETGIYKCSCSLIAY